MGLVANPIESAGTSTICLSTIPPLTRNTGAPRVVGLSHPMGLTMGRPGDHQGQREVLRATLEAGIAITEPRGYVELPFRWPEPRSTAIREPDPLPPIAQLLTKKPWLVPRLAAGRPPPH